MSENTPANNVVPLPTAHREQRVDEWVNPSNGMGMPGVDSRVGWMPVARARNQRWLRALWLAEGLAGRIVEFPADEMTRERGEVTLGKGYEDAQKKLRALLDEFNIWSKFAMVLKYDRAYGGGGLVMSLDDGMPWEQPVDVKRLRRVRALHRATPDELMAVRYYDDPDSPNAGRPAVYRWQRFSLPGRDMGGVVNRLVHESRVIAFTGLDVDDERMVENQGWGDSILARCEERIRDVAASLAGVGVGLQNFSQDVVNLEGLNDLLGTKDGRERLALRVRDMRAFKSMLGVLMLGKNDAYARQAVGMAGVADTIRELATSLSAITNMPVSVFLGTSEAGLGDTGASHRRNWQDSVHAQQENQLRPGFNKLIRLVLLSQEGPTGGVEPEKWELTFNPLERPTPQEKDTQRKLYADIDHSYIGDGVYRPEHVGKHRFDGPDGFNANLPPDPFMSEPPPPYEDPGATPAAEPSLEPGQEPAPQVDPVETPVAGVEAGSVADTALNGAQITGLFEGLKLAASGQLPRETVVQALALALNRPVERLEPVVGKLGAGFIPRPEEPAAPTPAAAAPPAPARQDDVTAYASLLLTELAQGTLSEEEVLGKVGKLYKVPPRQARALMKKLGKRRADVSPVTHFPRTGENRRVELASSRFEVFDPAYALDVKENWPEVWGLSSNPLGARQFERLLPVARSGGKAETDGEIHAVRLREEWARRNAKKERTAGVVAQVKQLVVGRMGEPAMKRVLEAAKEKVRRARATAGK